MSASTSPPAPRPLVIEGRFAPSRPPASGASRPVATRGAGRGRRRGRRCGRRASSRPRPSTRRLRPGWRERAGPDRRSPYQGGRSMPLSHRLARADRLLQRARLAGGGGRDPPGAISTIWRSSASGSWTEKDRLANDWAWDANESLGRPLLPHRAVLALLRLEGHRRAALPQVAGRLRLGAAREGAGVLVRPVPRPSRPARACPPTGTRTRPTGAATSTTRASPAGSRCRTSTPRTAACTSSTAATAGRPAAPPGRGDAERPDHLRGGREADGRLPDPPRRRHLPPLQDAAHDHRQQQGRPGARR